VRVETEIGYFVVRAWVTQGIRPGVVACSHHMGRWKVHDTGQRQMMATVSLDRDGRMWAMRRLQGARPYASEDPDTLKIWWTDVGVHQNLTFPVHPDPITGMHCWHQMVRVERAGAPGVDLDPSETMCRVTVTVTSLRKPAATPCESSAGQASDVFSETGPSAIGERATSKAAVHTRATDAPSLRSTSVTSTSEATPQSAISALNAAL